MNAETPSRAQRIGHNLPVRNEWLQRNVHHERFGSFFQLRKAKYIPWHVSEGIKSLFVTPIPDHTLRILAHSRQHAICPVSPWTIVAVLSPGRNVTRQKVDGSKRYHQEKNAIRRRKYTKTGVLRIKGTDMYRPDIMFMIRRVTPTLS